MRGRYCTTEWREGGRITDPPFAVLLGAAAASLFSLPLGRFLLAVATVLLVVESVRRRRVPALPRVAWLGAAFLAVTCVATLCGPNPELGCSKLDKLIWFVGIPVTAILVRGRDRVRALLLALSAGGVVLALDVCIFNPVRALTALRAGRFASFEGALIDQGSMTDGQRLGVVLLATIGLLTVRRARNAFAGRRGRARRATAASWSTGHGSRGFGVFLGVALGLQAAALIINFKRGSWIAALVTVTIFVSGKMKWKHVLLVMAAVGLSVLLPPVQSRLAALRTEFEPYHGGRMTMWRKIAPALIREHPWGVGYRALTNEMMRKHAPEVEANRDHLHSNVLQVLVATGWLGLALYLVWMARAVWDGWRYYRSTRGDPDGENPLALATLLMLGLLLLNGLVEYNFGDAEIVLLYGYILGANAAGVSRCAA